MIVHMLDKVGSKIDASAIGVIRRTSTAEAIVQHLLERIRGGEFRPGQMLPSERQLQTQLGVGRLSLREALARLSALGIIRVDHGKGACVQEHISRKALAQTLIPSFPDTDAKTLHDLVSARSLIEGELAAQAAIHRTDDDLERLRAVLLNGKEGPQNPTGLAELDYSFHREIARIADNEFLTVVVGALADHTRLFLLHWYGRPKRNLLSVVRRHRPILKAIEDGDAELAREHSCKHIDASKANLDAYVRWAKKKAKGTKGR